MADEGMRDLAASHGGRAGELGEAAGRIDGSGGRNPREAEAWSLLASRIRLLIACGWSPRPP